MTSFFMALALYCQDSWLVSQKAPKCVEEGMERHIRVSEIVEFQDFDFLFCKKVKADGRNDSFEGCRKGINVGCRIKMQHETIQSSYSCLGLPVRNNE